MARRVLIAVALAITALALVTRVSLLSTRRFDPDELEHAHVVWYISQGDVPYRDFFEMHPPLFHYLLAPVIGRFDVERADGAMRALFFLRACMWSLSVGIVVCTFALARRLREEYTAWLSLPILATDIVLAHRGVEIRPDGLAAIAWLACLVFLHSAICRDHPAARATRAAFAASGLCIGLGVLTSQKLLLAAPSLFVTSLWYVSSSTFGSTVGVRTRNALWQAAGCVVPWLVAILYFGARHAARAFIHAIVIQDLAWQPEATASTVLAFVSHFDPWLFGLAAGGACLLVDEALAEPGKRTSHVFLLLNTAGVFLGLFVIPAPFPQYCLMFIPLFAILAAGFLARVARGLVGAGDAGRRSASRAAWIVATAVFVVLVVVGLRSARPMVLAPLVYPAVIACAVLVMVSLPLHGRREAALGLAVIALAVYPAQWTRWMRAEGDSGQFAELRYVLTSTSPKAVVMDGWSGLGVFRQHAWYYWMLHPGVRAMLPAAAVNQLAADLRSGRVRPDLVILDENLRRLSNPVRLYLESHYRPTGIDDVYGPGAMDRSPSAVLEGRPGR
jgi:hypothetical protein